MVKKIILVLAFALLLCGCSPAAPQQPTPPSDVTLPGGFSMQGGQFSYGEASWPDYIPYDIPPIPADITQVMADDNTIRIFFNNMPKDAFESYLTQLYQNGFSLEFLVYEQPGVSEEDVERFIREGKYDAVRITKGDYKMYIEYGADMGTYDIDPKGFPEGTVIENKVGWPAQLNGIMNQPANSKVTSVMTIGERLEISCESDNKELFADYGAQLEAEGFIKGRVATNQNNVVMNISYTKGNILVELLNFKPGAIGIHYKPEGNIGEPQIPGNPTPPATVSENWPESLPESLPEFTDGKILISMDFNETTQISIECTADALDDYRALLLSSGFTAQGDDVYSGSDCTVKIETYLNSDVSLLTVTLKD